MLIAPSVLIFSKRKQLHPECYWAIFMGWKWLSQNWDWPKVETAAFCAAVPSLWDSSFRTKCWKFGVLIKWGERRYRIPFTDVGHFNQHLYQDHHNCLTSYRSGLHLRPTEADSQTLGSKKKELNRITKWLLCLLTSRIAFHSWKYERIKIKEKKKEIQNKVVFF